MWTHKTRVCCVGFHLSDFSHGPRQVRGRQYAGQAELNVTFNMAPFCDVSRFKPGKDVESPGSAALVEQALLPAIRLDLLPKASIDIYVTCLLYTSPSPRDS